VTIPFEKLKAEWMRSFAFRDQYEKLKSEFDRLRASIRSKTEASGQIQGKSHRAD
jgi:hypothetical protein